MKLFNKVQEWFLKRYFLLFCLLLQGNFNLVNGQTFAFQHITEKEGLPSTYLYGILQDENGYIWLTGESGLVWFDGHEYHVPDFQDDLEDEVIKLIKGNGNQFWMQDLAGRFFFLENNKARYFPEIKPTTLYEYTTFYKQPNGDIWIANTDDVYIYKTETDSIIPLQVDLTNELGKHTNLTSLKAFGQNENAEVVLITRFGYHVFSGDNYQNKFQAFEDLDFYNEFERGMTIDNKPYMVYKNQFYTLNSETKRLEPVYTQFNEYFEGGVVSAFRDSNNNLWIGTKKGLLLIEEKKGEAPKISKHLDGNVMGGILEDTEGSLWFITGNNGIFRLPSTHVKVFNDFGTEEQIRFIKHNNNEQLILGFDNNEFIVLDDSFDKIYGSKLLKDNSRVYDLVFDEDDTQYFLTSTGFVQADENFKTKKFHPTFSIKAGAIAPDGKLWLSCGTAIRYFEKGEHEKIGTALKKRSYSLKVISENEIWFGTIEGPYLYKNGRCQKLPNENLQYDIRDIEMLENGLLLFATQKNGLVFYEPSQDSIVLHLKESNGLSNNNCSKMLIDDQYIWLGTKKGVNKISKSDYSLSFIGIDQGLPSNEINDIYKKKDQFYIATNRGMAVFKDDISVKRTAPGLLITNIKIDERDTTIHESYCLDYSNNNIKIEFGSITFKDADQAIYQYKMEGLDDNWIESKINIAQYPSLPAGDYTFFVKAKTINSEWCPMQSLKFEIKTPFWDSWWFYVLSGIGLVFLSFLIFQEMNRRRTVVRDLKFSQLTALRAQMNPHFVFNALNSIQEFIVEKDTRLANRYLSRFAKLMRNILNASDQNQISLNKEIETLNLYLSLEALRFGKSFEYIFEVDEKIDKDIIHLPPMLIQPFVENSIKHGLMHRKGEKKLYLRFYLKNNLLVCEVEDNGIGREKSSEIKMKNPNIYPSKATNLTNERLKLVNSISNNSLEVEVIDLVHGNDPSGTKVILKINADFKGG